MDLDSKLIKGTDPMLENSHSMLLLEFEINFFLAFAICTLGMYVYLSRIVSLV